MSGGRHKPNPELVVPGRDLTVEELPTADLLELAEREDDRNVAEACAAELEYRDTYGHPKADD